MKSIATGLMAEMQRLYRRSPDEVDQPLIVEPTTKSCDVHGEFVAQPVTFGSSVIAITQCPTCESERRAARQANERQSFMKEALTMSGIPSKDQRGLDTFPEVGRVAVKWLMAWIDRHEELNRDEKPGAWLVLHGPNGTGKSGLAASTCYEFMRRGKHARFITMSDLKSFVWNAQHRGSNHSQAIVDVTASALLVIDDVGATKMKDAEVELLSEVIDVRYRNRLPMIFPMNVNKPDITSVFGPRSASRIFHRAGWISCAWPSLRIKTADHHQTQPS